MTYWQTYRQEKPEYANQIISLGLNFYSQPNNDVREKCLSLEAMSREIGCPISNLKNLIIEELNKIEDPYCLYYIDQFETKKLEAADEYNISPDNTFFAIAQEWMWERVEEIEQRYAHLPPLSSKNVIELIPKFGLESPNKLSIKKKIHIYTKNFPRPQADIDYVKLIERIFDTYFERFVAPFASNSKIRSNPQLFNLMLSAHVFQYWDKLTHKDDEVKDLIDVNGLIQECNRHNVSFYLELDFASERIKNKYRM